MVQMTGSAETAVSFCGMLIHICYAFSQYLAALNG